MLFAGGFIVAAIGLALLRRSDHPKSGDAFTVAPTLVVDANTAQARVLTALPHVGPTLVPRGSQPQGRSSVLLAGDTPEPLLPWPGEVWLAQIASLEAKIRLERTDPTGKYLLYSPAEEPDFADDWLLDIRLYSGSFRADRASLLVQELGLLSSAMRLHLAERRRFFDAKDRLQKLKAFVNPDDDAASLDRKMIAVIAKADPPEPFNLVQAIFHAWNDAGDAIDLDNPPAAWTQIEKFDLDGPFWRMAKSKFGYEEDNPTLKKLLVKLMLADYAHGLKGEVPQAIRGLLLPRPAWSNVVVCLSQWRDSTSRHESYDRLSAEAAAFLKIEDHLPKLEIEDLVEIQTFLAVEKRIASALSERSNRPRIRSTPTTSRPSPPGGKPDTGHPSQGAKPRTHRATRFTRCTTRLQLRRVFSLYGTNTKLDLAIPTPPRFITPTRRSFIASTSSTVSSARPPTPPKIRDGVSSSHFGPP